MNRTELTARLGRVGIWTRQLDMSPGVVAEQAAAEIEALGWQSLWIPEAMHRDVLVHASLLLAATEHLVVATGVARVHARGPQAMALTERHLNERFPGRLLLGLGVSHPFIVQRILGQEYGPPVETMSTYLDAMDATRYGPAPMPTDNGRVLAALGPKMLELATRRAAGVHTYMAPVAHTAWAREQLGDSQFLAPNLKVVLTNDPTEGLAIARWSTSGTIKSPAYRTNLLRVGFAAGDLEGGLSDAVVHALVAIGDEDAIAARVREHLDAGADHVCIEVLTGDDTTVPMDAWRRLASLGVQT